MATRLWDIVDGEPFFVNPHLLIAGANPRKKKGKKSMAARKRRATRRHINRPRRRGRKATARRKARVVVINPRRKKHSRRRHHRINPVARRRHHRRRRNPSIMGFALPPLMPVVYVGVGFAAPAMIEGFVSGYLPTAISSSTVGKYGIRAGVVFGTTYLAKRFLGSNAGFYIGLGGFLYLATSLLREFLPESKPYVPGLGAYTVPGFTTRAISGGSGLGAYTHQQLSQGGTGASYTMGVQQHGGSQFGAKTGTPIRFRRLQ